MRFSHLRNTRSISSGPKESQISCNFFGSAHPNGFNAVMCDGSVRTIRYSIAIETLRALTTRAGGEAIDFNSF